MHVFERQMTQACLLPLVPGKQHSTMKGSLLRNLEAFFQGCDSSLDAFGAGTPRDNESVDKNITN